MTTFGKAVITDSTTGETETTIFFNGEDVGSIEKQVDNIGVTGYEWVASSYSVTIWPTNDDDELIERLFRVAYRKRDWGLGRTVMTEGFETARKALAAAKAFARQEGGK